MCHEQYRLQSLVFASPGEKQAVVADAFFGQFPVDARKRALHESVQSDEFSGIRCRRLHRNRFELNRFREMRHGCCPANRKRLSRFGDNLAGFKTPNADDEHNEQNRDYRNKDEAECFDHP
jgi:hypothetical protein